MASDLTTPPPHSKCVQAWVYAIINPLLEGLRREVSLLDKGNLSWRFYSKRCEYIRPISEYIESSQLPNYEDFVADNPGFKAGFKEHDHQVSRVEFRATQFVDRLMGSNLFRKEVNKSLGEYESGVRGKPLHPSLDSMKEDLPRYVAEYLINQADLLPHHYRMHKFWEDYRPEFEPYHQRPSFQALKKATGALLDISDRLLPDLENHRHFLCSTYDIPYAPIRVDQSPSADAFTV